TCYIEERILQCKYGRNEGGNETPPVIGKNLVSTEESKRHLSLKGKITEICRRREAIVGCDRNRSERRNSTAGDRAARETRASREGYTSRLRLNMFLYDCT